MTTTLEAVHNLVPRNVSIVVRQHDAEIAEQGAAGACAFAAAFYHKYPDFKNVMVTATTIALTDPTIRVRYVWVTPDDVCEWITGWDHTDDKIQFLKDNPPPKLSLPRGQAMLRQMKVKSAEKRLRDRNYNKKLRAEKALRSTDDVMRDERKSAARRRKIRGTGL